VAPAIHPKRARRPKQSGLRLSGGTLRALASRVSTTAPDRTQPTSPVSATATNPLTAGNIGPGGDRGDARPARWLIAGRMRRPAPPVDDAPHIVIVGAGFGGMACAARLRRERAQVTLIDRHNYHLFQPLLYQVATAALSPADIAIPVRGMFRDHPRLRVLRGQVSGVDVVNRCITVDGRRLPYDVLVLATGASHGYFGHEEWAATAPGLKSVNDATSIRSRILDHAGSRCPAACACRWPSV
jgi:Pyridine nucleotide-disulphide oxidoreductase